jgi:hypothetical protein
LARLGVIVPIALAVPSQDVGQGGPHLEDVLGRTRIDRITDGRLLRTGVATEGSLQHGVRTDTRVDLDQTAATREYVDEAVQEFVEWCMLTDFLFDVDVGLDHRPNPKFLEMDTQRDQAGAG